jgi:UDP-glucose 4-epimerase
MRALVTGGAGFVGAHVARSLLDAGTTVAVVDDLSTGHPDNLRLLGEAGLAEQETFALDVCSEHAADAIGAWRPDVVVHLAAQARVAQSVCDPLADARLNVVGTVNVLAAAARAGARVVLASSGGTVYGDQVGAASPTGELRPTVPLSPYGLSKATAEAYAAMYGELFGVRSTVLRLGNVYGCHLDGSLGPGVLSEFVRSCASGETPTINGDGRQTRDFVAVEDVAEAFGLVCRRLDRGVLNVGSGAETSVLDACRLVCTELGVECRPRHIQPATAEVHRVCLDVSQARVRLGWRADTSLALGIKRLVAGFRAAPSPAQHE